MNPRPGRRYKLTGLFGANWWITPSASAPLRINANGICRDSSEPDDRPVKAQVRICLRFLAQCEPAAAPHIFSYGLKHVVEHWAGEYVSNGALIEAARQLSIPFVISDGPNAALFITKCSVRRIAGTGTVSGSTSDVESPGEPYSFRQANRDGIGTNDNMSVETDRDG